MKKKLLIIFLFVVFSMLLMGFYTLKYLRAEKIPNENRTVFIKKTETGHQLYRNGNPFYIQGATGIGHLKDLADIGGNTIRVYDTINIGYILDEAQKYNLAVIVDIPIPAYSDKYDYYSNPHINYSLKQRIVSIVRKHRDHPALLLWNLGNELNYPPVFWKNNFINVFNELLDIIQREDSNHPVGTTLYGVGRRQLVSFYFHSPQIDFLSFNIFGNIKYLKNRLEQFSLLFNSFPYYISELASDGYWESERTSWNAPIEQTTSKKMEQIRVRYESILNLKDGACLGSLIFYWGNKHEITFTWFSLFDNNYKSEIIKEMERFWGKSNKKLCLIGLEYMLVDTKGAADNIVFAPNELKVAELSIKDCYKDSLRIKWEIFPEDWFTSTDDNTLIFSNALKPIENIVFSQKNTTTFTTPSIEGPYRIFAYVYDQNGYFASANTPFYVLGTK